MDLVIKNGTVVTGGVSFRADVGIEGANVKQIGHGSGPSRRQIDAPGKYLLPGGVDVHTHVDV